MNFGLRKMQMSSAAVPPIRTSPMRRLGSRSLGDALEADPARALHEHGVALAHAAPRRSRGGLRGVRDRVVAAACRAAASGPTVTSTSTPLARVRADLLVEAVLVGAELEHVAEHGDAPPAARAASSSRAARIDIGLAL